MRARTVLASVAVSLLSATAIATPAYANDLTLTIDQPRTAANTDARAHWDDLTDTLCLKANTGWALAQFRRPNGQLVRVIDTASTPGPDCTGNLRIREDYHTHLSMAHDWNDYEKIAGGWFYT